ncbi:hypothetical protein PF008_g20923 [Phytophthora fragariae]|uniref:Uncharacterized protein n=1 Tax=Phytophthora fragariae TaxID=53985 RepID=A0A6G0QZ51_9STRA|nr:hypothetical protein PF008_g20923 [Phytophthora fragariae]
MKNISKSTNVEMIEGVRVAKEALSRRASSNARALEDPVMMNICSSAFVHRAPARLRQCA